MRQFKHGYYFRANAQAAAKIYPWDKKLKSSAICDKLFALAAGFLYSTKERVNTEELKPARWYVLKNRQRLFIFAILFILLIIAPVILNIYYNFLLEPVSKETTIESKFFVIRPGTPVVNISYDLKEDGLIKNSLAFRLLVAQMGIGKNIQAGDFRISPSMSSREIANQLTHGAVDIWITLPEGLRIEEQATIIEEKLKFGSNDTYQFDKNEFIKLAEEGYMFPDTYLIPKDATANFVVKKLRETFNIKVNESLIISASQNDLSETELINLASIIERESKTPEEKPIIAGILINRLENGIALQVDATVQYAKGYDSAQNTWWPQVTTADYDSVNSPYNTYLLPGLPPKPISSPGLASIKAAASPADTEFLYYLHDKNGNIHYAKTYEEHNDNIQQYLLQ